MRPLTTQQLQNCSFGLELPMGCCCSKKSTKIEPLLQNRREQERKLIDNVFAPSILAVTPSSRANNNASRASRSYSFGEARYKSLGILSRESSISSHEYIHPYEDITQYNDTLEKKAKSRIGSRVHGEVKISRIDTPPYPLINGHRPDKKEFDFNDVFQHPSKPKRHGKGQVAKKLREPTPPPSLQRNRPVDYLHYKRIEKADNLDSNANNSSSEDEMRNVVVLKREKDGKYKGKIVERKMVSVRRKDGTNAYYQRTYSKDNFGRQNENESNDNRDEDESRKTETSEQRKRRAQEQRLLDRYLAQPKSIVVPIIRESRPQVGQTGQSARRPRKILKKPWRVRSSQKNSVRLMTSATKTGIESGTKIRNTFPATRTVVTSRADANMNLSRRPTQTIGNVPWAVQAMRAIKKMEEEKRQNRKHPPPPLTDVGIRRLPESNRIYSDDDDEAFEDESLDLDDGSRSKKLLSRSRKKQHYTENYVKGSRNNI